MKKIICVAFVILCMVSLSSCITFKMKINDINPEDVESIEFYCIDNRDDRGSGFYKTYDSIYTLPDGEKASFLGDLAKIQFSDTIILLGASDPSFSYGKWVARVNMTNGNSRFISCAGHGETIDKDGNVVDYDHYGCPDEVWDELISKYIPQ